jgi:hypothetical protein
MNDSSLAFLQLIEKAKNLIERGKRKFLKAPVASSALKLDCQGQAAGDLIRIQLEKAAPCLICRIGKVELDVALRYLNIRSNGDDWIKLGRYLFLNSGPFWWDDQIRSVMHTNAGFIPTTNENLARFADRMLQDIQAIDILGSWLPSETRVAGLFPQARIIPLMDLEPYYHPDPWSQVLRGRKVLVVHPFETSIRSQYNHRDRLFRDPRILPEFELQTFKALYAIGSLPAGFSDWFEALEWMSQQIEQRDFEVALIGAGPYGLSIAARVKKMGRKAIVLGGATQILFGIRGRRWDNMPFFQQLYNEFWIRPLLEDTPQNYQAVEKGCYW